jgi:hypothetical protein
MAYEMQIRGSEGQAKIRSPWAAALLPIITIGIYHLVWWYRINRELRDYGHAKGYDLGQNPTNSLLALFPGGLIIVPALVSYWRGTQRIQGAARLAGQEPVSGWLSIILYVVIAPGFWAYLQVALNNLWRSEADLLPGQAELPPTPSEMPPRLPEEPQATPAGQEPQAPATPSQEPEAPAAPDQGPSAPGEEPPAPGPSQPEPPSQP